MLEPAEAGGVVKLVDQAQLLADVYGMQWERGDCELPPRGAGPAFSHGLLRVWLMDEDLERVTHTAFMVQVGLAYLGLQPLAVGLSVCGKGTTVVLIVGPRGGWFNLPSPAQEFTTDTWELLIPPLTGLVEASWKGR
jgi:hypothetical protein